jgi:hypothetical protein
MTNDDFNKTGERIISASILLKKIKCTKDQARDYLHVNSLILTFIVAKMSDQDRAELFAVLENECNQAI